MNPLILLGAIPSALAALALAWLLHTVDVGRIEARQRDALQEQATALQDKCDADKEITANAEQTYQDKITALDNKLRDLRNVRPARCIVPTANTPKRPNATTEPAKLFGPYGLSTDWLYDYAGRAEECRLKLIGLQGFIRDTWRANGQ